MVLLWKPKQMEARQRSQLWTWAEQETFTHCVFYLASSDCLSLNKEFTEGI